MTAISLYPDLKAITLDQFIVDKAFRLFSDGGVLQSFRHQDIDELKKYLKAYQVEKGKAVFVEDREAGYLCMIVDGVLEVVKDTDKGQSRKISMLRAGKTVGEMSVIDGMKPSATVVAVEDSVLLVLSRKDLAAIIKANPNLAVKILVNIARIMSDRLRKTSAEFANFLS